MDGKLIVSSSPHISSPVKTKNIMLDVSGDAKNVILNKSYKKEYGARPMRRYIERYIEDSLAQKLISAELSGGQRRRVEIARALLCPGGAVILDEPFTGLDTAARDACAEVVLDLLDGRMLLLATHDAADAKALNISDIITL